MEEEKKTEGKLAEEESEKPLEKMTVKDLREIAKDIPGVAGVHAMKKQELLDLIREYRGIEEEKPAKKREKGSGKISLTLKEMKEKIARLRDEKAAARDARDRKKVDILRRRINRLKKETRKVVKG